MTGPDEIRVSVLDNAPIVEGSSANAALRNSVELAQLADDLGYHRYWVPEHHGMRGVASAAPAVVVGRIAAATRRIRVGAGGVMLPNHPPIVVAEQFGTLQAFHPGRVDLGLGRALGGPREVAERVRGERERTAAPFEDQIRELLSLFEPDSVAVPAAGNPPEVWLLGSGDHTARIAGVLGLPFAFAHHLKPANATAALRAYRQAFRPSPRCPTPRVMVSVSVIVAATDERARWLAGSLRMKVARRQQGTRIPLPTPQAAAAAGYAARADDFDAVFIGAPGTVGAQLRDLVAATGAVELLVKTDVHGHADRCGSFELLRREWP